MLTEFDGMLELKPNSLDVLQKPLALSHPVRRFTGAGVESSSTTQGFQQQLGGRIGAEQQGRRVMCADISQNALV